MDNCDSHSGSLWLPLALTCYLRLSLALSGSYWISPCLFLALYGSLWLPLWLSLALTATLWHTLALSGSLLLSNFAYTALDRLTGPLLGPNRRCHDDALYPALGNCKNCDGGDVDDGEVEEKDYDVHFNIGRSHSRRETRFLWFRGIIFFKYYFCDFEDIQRKIIQISVILWKYFLKDYSNFCDFPFCIKSATRGAAGVSCIQSSCQSQLWKIFFTWRIINFGIYMTRCMVI